MGVKWIHKGEYSRPDKRTIRKGGGKKKWDAHNLIGISGKLSLQDG